MDEQQELAFRTWGGKRRGAGRRAAQERGRVPHVPREAVRAYQPVHVTLRMADHVWNLRSERSYAVIHCALEAARRRSDARVVHFSVQGNHVHLILEADGTREPSRSGWIDPFSSAAVKMPRTGQRVLFAEAVTRPAGTWLVRSAGT